MNTIFLMAPPAEGANPLVSLLPWIGVFVVFYFFMIRPQMKKSKELKKFREELKEGDKIITAGGIHGKIKTLAETSVVIETEGGQLRIEKSALSQDGVVLGQKK
ncbi:MAG: preprotein translocase subunit YajC [Sphingobacteriales bacterium]|jgi:preprotein translocase subunit YajC